MLIDGYIDVPKSLQGGNCTILNPYNKGGFIIFI